MFPLVPPFSSTSLFLSQRNYNIHATISLLPHLRRHRHLKIAALSVALGLARPFIRCRPTSSSVAFAFHQSPQHSSRARRPASLIPSNTMPPSARTRGTSGAFVEREASTLDSFDDGMPFATVPSTPQGSRLGKLTVSELKQQLKDLNLPVSGLKADLIQRLDSHHQSSPILQPDLERTSNGTVKSRYFSTATDSEKASTPPVAKGTAKRTPTPTKSSRSTSKSPKRKSDESNDFVTPTKSKTKSPTAKSTSPRKRIKIEPGSMTPPFGWEDIYSLVKELRSDRSAPVDTDGGEALPEKHLGEVVHRYQVLMALMLSSQTKDAVVGETMRSLQKHGLTVENIHKTDSELLNKLIGKVGFHNNKTKYIKQATEIIITQYNGDIPSTADELMTLPGVGPKMAYIVESVAFGTVTGIGVDTHMHRIFNQLAWVDSKNPEGTREQLEGWLPRDKWDEVNVLWVGFGQEVQQQKEKMLKKALQCSAPKEALRLLDRLGLDVEKEGKRFGLEDKVNIAMAGK